MQVQLAAKQVDGATLREHLVIEARHTGAPDRRLLATVPEGVEDLWSTFCDLNATARPAGFGACGIPPSEVLAWQQLRGVQLTPWEVDTLAALDRATLAANAAAAPAPAPTPKGPSR